MEDDEVKAAMVKRINRTLRDKMHRYMTKHRTRRHVHGLDDIVESYNNSTHVSIRMTPNEVNNKMHETEPCALFRDKKSK